jgi:hypothetical protein
VKRAIINILRAAAGIAGVVFLVMPLRTFTMVLGCVASFMVMIICSIVAGNLDDENTGFWPKKPD